MLFARLFCLLGVMVRDKTVLTSSCLFPGGIRVQALQKTGKRPRGWRRACVLCARRCGPTPTPTGRIGGRTTSYNSAIMRCWTCPPGLRRKQGSVRKAGWSSELRNVLPLVPCGRGDLLDREARKPSAETQQGLRSRYRTSSRTSSTTSRIFGTIFFPFCILTLCHRQRSSPL